MIRRFKRDEDDTDDDDEAGFETQQHSSWLLSSRLVWDTEKAKNKDGKFSKITDPEKMLPKVPRHIKDGKKLYLRSRHLVTHIIAAMLP